jgi:AcrR family transcriptional regulator
MSTAQSTAAEAEHRKPGRPRDAGADQAILEAAVAEIADAGFGAFTVDAVAARAGVGKATIYRRWPGKEALLLDAASLVVEAPDAPDTGSLRGDLVELFLRVHHQKTKDPHANLMAGLVAEACVNDEMKALLGQYVSRRRATSVELIERGVARGELPADVDRDLLLDLLSGMLFYRTLFANRAVDAATIGAAVDLVLDGARS